MKDCASPPDNMADNPVDAVGIEVGLEQAFFMAQSIDEIVD
jgi:hypothetical protein